MNIFREKVTSHHMTHEISGITAPRDKIKFEKKI
jgi:hypothetical protein